MSFVMDETMLTPAQCIALVKVYNRVPIYETKEHEEKGIRQSFEDWLTFNMQPGFDCIMLRWQGMWLGIEKDGYTHS